MGSGRRVIGLVCMMGERRIELVETTLCEHGLLNAHDYLYGVVGRIDCEGGSRRTLTAPTEQMVEAAARSYHAEVGRRSGVDLAWETSYDSEQADFLRVTRAALEAAFAAFGSTTEEET